VVAFYEELERVFVEEVDGSPVKASVETFGESVETASDATVCEEVDVVSNETLAVRVGDEAGFVLVVRSQAVEGKVVVAKMIGSELDMEVVFPGPLVGEGGRKWFDGAIAVSVVL